MPATLKRPGGLETRTKLCEWGSSRAVRIPKRMCDEGGICVGSELDMLSGTDDRGFYIVIRASEGHRSYGDAPLIPMEEAFAGYRGGYVPTEFDWGCDVGAEVVE